MWNISDHITVVFNTVDDYQKLYTAILDPRSGATLMRKGIRIIQKTGEMELALIKWNARPQTDKTWANFKTLFFGQISTSLHGPWYNYERIHFP